MAGRGQAAAQAPAFFGALNMLRQVTFDHGAKGDLDMRAQGRFGHSWSIEAGNYRIHWVIINTDGNGFVADMDDVHTMQDMFDHLISEDW